MGELIPGPWKRRPDQVYPADVRWRRGRPLPTERTRCAVCDRPFSKDAWVPVDKTCRDCRADRERAAQEAADPSLFDPSLFDGPGGTELS